MFRYRKLYVDLVSERGEVCVVYSTSLSIAGLELNSAGFERYTPEGERHVERALGVAEIEKGPGRLRLSFDTARGALSLNLRGAETSTYPQALTPHLSWQIVAGSGESRLAHADGVVLSGSGYADYVEMTRPPRALGLRTVEWGRGHVGSEGFVFTRATFRDGSVFQSALDAGRQCGDWRLDRDSEKTLVDLPSGAVELWNERLLHEGSALDRARFPALGERLVAQLCSGRVHERRWLARARFPSGASGWALHERVALGS